MELSCISDRSTKLLSVLRRELHLSDGLVRRLKPFEPFSVNGQTAHTDHIIRPGDEIKVRIEEQPPSFPAEDGALSVIFEDEALIVLDKPAGILVHPTANRLTGTLANRLLGYYQKTDQPCAVHILTRLDRDTMGLVVYGKNAFIHAVLMEALADGQVRKTYYAEVCGCPAEEEGVIDLPIARLREGSLLRCVRPDGKRAITHYRVLAQKEATSLLALSPVTGRTHQLRVHCSHLGIPIVGDPQYGGGTGGQRLIAGHLTLPHPLTGKPLSFRSLQAEALLMQYGISAEDAENSAPLSGTYL